MMLPCTATLQKKELWEQFHGLGTEMIITKSGRRMFPALRVQIYHLEPLAHYCVILEMVPIGKCRYKYSASGGWTPAGAEEAQSHLRVYLHPESPATGEHWMSQGVSFGRMKLTNTSSPPPGHVVLTSMHKYQPRIIIVKSADPRAISWAPATSVIFPETQFIAVTAYQNEKITKLKIDHNPFAKGFRANGHSKCKRKRLMLEQERRTLQEEEPEIVIKEEPLVSPVIDISDERSSSGSTTPELSHPEPFQANATSSPVCSYHHPPYAFDYHSYYYHYGYPVPYMYPSRPLDVRPPVENKPTQRVSRRYTDFSIDTILNVS